MSKVSIVIQRFYFVESCYILRGFKWFACRCTAASFSQGLSQTSPPMLRYVCEQNATRYVCEQWQQSCHSRASFSIIAGIHCSAHTLLYTWNNVLILRIKHSSQNHKKQCIVRVCTTYAHYWSLRCHLNFSQTLLVFRGHSNRHKLWANQIL